MDLMEIRRRVMMAGALRTIDAQGNPVKFSTYAALPLKQNQIYFAPVQERTGDPSPSNIRPITGWDRFTVCRSGENIIPPDHIVEGKVISATGVISDDSTGCYLDFIPVIENKYAIGGLNTASSSWHFRLHGYDANHNWVKQISDTLVAAYRPYLEYFEPEPNIKYVRLSLPLRHSSHLYISPRSTHTTYSPYTGYNSYDVSWASELAFPASGKNLFNESTISPGYFPTTTIHGLTLNNAYRAVILTLPPGTYTVSTDLADVRFLRAWYDNAMHTGLPTGNAVTITTTTTGLVGFVFRKSDTSAITETIHTMIESGSTVTAYEPFDNAVYGGYVDMVTGEVWETWHKFYFRDIETWYAASTAGVYYSLSVPYARELSDDFNILSNKYVTVDPAILVGDMANYSLKGYARGGQRIYIKDTSFANVDAFKAGTLNDYFVWQLATPILVGTLTPQQIKALAGKNVLWSNANDDIHLQYLST